MEFPKTGLWGAVLFLSAAAAHSQGNLRKVLVFNKPGLGTMQGEPREPADSMMASLARAHGFSIRISQDSNLFTDDSLRQYQIIAWNNVMRNVLSSAQQAAFIRYMEGGGGYVGWHASGTNRGIWPWYVDSLLGGDNAPGYAWGAAAVFADTIPRAGHSLGVNHPIMTGIPRDFSAHGNCEWYNLSPNPANNPAITVLQWYTARSIDASWPALLPATWCREYGSGSVKGRLFYTQLSHVAAIYSDADYQRMILNALRWAARDNVVALRPFENVNSNSRSGKARFVPLPYSFLPGMERDGFYLLNGKYLRISGPTGQQGALSGTEKIPD